MVDKKCKIRKIEVYSTENCPYCEILKSLLNKEKIPFKDIKIDSEEKAKKVLELTGGKVAVPVVVIDDTEVIIGLNEEEIFKNICKKE
ncbi:MAG: glutaredoxin family protein [Candidatus Heimdallarchaeaceae archaeon]